MDFIGEIGLARIAAAIMLDPYKRRILSNTIVQRKRMIGTASSIGQRRQEVIPLDTGRDVGPTRRVVPDQLVGRAEIRRGRFVAAAN